MSNAKLYILFAVCGSDLVHSSFQRFTQSLGVFNSGWLEVGEKYIKLSFFKQDT